MLNELKKDPLIRFLLARCSVSEAQLDTILLSQSDDKLEVRASKRDKGKVSTGSFMRTLRQGQKNIESCLYTLILLEYLRLVKADDLEKIGRLGRLISEVKQSTPSQEAVTRLVQALESFIEGFSGRRKLIV
ncbi:MAG: hypothetical protein ACYCQJ_01655 [Nitrososphaerales archaeon]